MSKKRIPNGFLDEIPEAYCGEPEENVADVVIAPDLRSYYEDAKRRANGFPSIELQLIERVSKAEQENAALRAKVARLEAPISDVEMDEFSLHQIDLVQSFRRVNVLVKYQADALIAARGREGESEVQP